jgi:hypothetical protein
MLYGTARRSIPPGTNAPGYDGTISGAIGRRAAKGRDGEAPSRLLPSPVRRGGWERLV